MRYYLENISCSDPGLYREFANLGQAILTARMTVKHYRYGLKIRRLGTDGVVHAFYNE